MQGLDPNSGSSSETLCPGRLQIQRSGQSYCVFASVLRAVRTTVF